MWVKPLLFLVDNPSVSGAEQPDLGSNCVINMAKGIVKSSYFPKLRYKPPGSCILQGGINEKLNTPG